MLTHASHFISADNNKIQFYYQQTLIEVVVSILYADFLT